jgi:hypothetical protein
MNTNPHHQKIQNYLLKRNWEVLSEHATFRILTVNGINNCNWNWNYVQFYEEGHGSRGWGIEGLNFSRAGNTFAEFVISFQENFALPS